MGVDCRSRPAISLKRQHSTKVHSKSPEERRARRLAAVKRYDESPKGRYKQHKRNAKIRGVEFLMTFEEWYELWEPYLDRRGNHADGYVMARHGDDGPYAVGNVEIKLHVENVAERNRWYFAERRWTREYETDDFAHVHGAPDVDSARPVENGAPGSDVPF